MASNGSDRIFDNNDGGSDLMLPEINSYDADIQSKVVYDPNNSSTMNGLHDKDLEAFMIMWNGAGSPSARDAVARTTVSNTGNNQNDAAIDYLYGSEAEPNFVATAATATDPTKTYRVNGLQDAANDVP